MSTILGESRRRFIAMASAVAAGLAAGCSRQTKETPSRLTGAKYMGGFKAPRLDTVRCAFIGVGARGVGHARQIAEIEGSEVVAICDLFEDLALRSQKHCQEAGNGQRHTDIKLYYENGDSWKQMLEEVRPDAVFICTPWRLHAPMAIEAMKQEAHAFVEVPLGLTNEELWDIVDTSEITGRHCMMMENVNYGREELLYLNMCRQGVIGELLHGDRDFGVVDRLDATSSATGRDFADVAALLAVAEPSVPNLIGSVTRTVRVKRRNLEERRESALARRVRLEQSREDFGECFAVIE